MTRSLALLSLALWAGATLALADLAWFRRLPLAERLRPYAAGGMGRPAARGSLSVASFRDAVGPVSAALGERLARFVGVGETCACAASTRRSTPPPSGSARSGRAPWPSGPLRSSRWWWSGRLMRLPAEERVFP